MIAHQYRELCRFAVAQRWQIDGKDVRSERLEGPRRAGLPPVEYAVLSVTLQLFEASMIGGRTASTPRVATRPLDVSTGKADAPEQVDEASVAAQRVETRVHFEVDQIEVAVLVSLLEPFQGGLQLAQSDGNQGHIEGRHIALLGPLQKLIPNRSGLGRAAGQRISMGE